MGDLIHLPVTENEDGFGTLSASRRRGTDSPFLGADVSGKGNVIPIDARSQNLRRVGYRGRKLEKQESRL